jgi:predicted RNase H-like HicB family nuclease
MKNQFVYPAVLEDDEEGYYVEFPDVKGCHTEGNDLNEAMINAKEALELSLEVLIEKGEKLPTPSTPDDIEGRVMLIVADMSNMESLINPVEKRIFIPYWLHRESEKAHLNLSQLLQEALEEKLIASAK